ncbi:MAG TPA: phosphate starvation-inducible protein PhoH, partial [Saprospiraceae bacterium]|nr:phosphate starvation-inducible protein PhoH [Saprospiraceae bacterium]
MNELIIELTEISPQEFFGQQNTNISQIKEYFPKLKIIARGNKIKALGDPDILQEFDKRVSLLLEHFMKYNKLDENAIERILLSNGKKDYETPVSSNDILVHGVGGNKIKARTVNQRKLVELMKSNDMVFAVG